MVERSFPQFQQSDNFFRQHAFVARRRLHFHVEPGAFADDLQHFPERQHPLAGELGAKPTTRVELPQRSPVVRPDSTAAVRCTLELEIMNDHQLFVTAQLNVELDHIDTLVQGASEGGARVLRRRPEAPR
jgi:hypothetical protein